MLDGSCRASVVEWRPIAEDPGSRPPTAAAGGSVAEPCRSGPVDGATTNATTIQLSTPASAAGTRKYGDRMVLRLLGYVVARLGLFFIAALILMVVGLRGPVLLLGALIASALLSYPLLKRHRQAVDRSWSARRSA